MDESPLAQVLVGYANENLHLKVENAKLMAELDSMKRGDGGGDTDGD